MGSTTQANNADNANTANTANTANGAGALGGFVYEPPGPGEWMLDTTHMGRRPLTPLMRVMAEVMDEGLSSVFERFGLPLEGMDLRQVGELFYARPRAIGDNGKGGSAPPTPIMWLVARLHPALRRRNRIAEQAWAERRWRHDVDAWFDGGRDDVIATNLDLQRVDVAALADDELVAHVAAVHDHVREQALLSFATHGGDIIPIGDYLAHCERWGIDAGEAAGLLRGASPASTETARLLAPVAQLLTQSTNTATAASADAPVTVDDMRGLGDTAAQAIDRWLELHGWRLLNTADLDGLTLAEHPDLQAKAIRAAAATPPDDTPPDAAAVRSRVPDADRAQFDELLTEARYGLRLRDDNVGVRWNWPAGLLRRALLEVGRRLVAGGRAHHAEHAVELDRSEIAPSLRGTGPSADELEARLDLRLAVEAANPPAVLGEPEDPPPLHAFPRPLARATAAALALIEAMEGAPSPRGRGVGVGSGTYVGTARVVTDAHEAFQRLEAGDVLVAPFTSPSFNSLIPLLGALVVEEGGAMCHAAIVAREFGIPAVIGVEAATELFADGQRLEIDPDAGTVVAQR